MDRILCMEAFVRVAEAKNFSEAARSWGRSKAVVSKYVHQLESHLAVKLFHRSTRAVALTDAGHMHLESCRQLLDSLHEAEIALRDAHASISGKLRISAPSGFFSGKRSSVLASFIAQNPEVHLELDMSSRLVSIVAEKIDVAIRITRPVDSELIARKLAPTRLIVVASPDYLSREGTPRSPRALRNHRCLIDDSYGFGSCWPLRYKEKLVNVEVDGPARGNEPFILRELALDGAGIALLPELVVSEDIESGHLRQIPIGQALEDWAVYAITSHRRHLAARVQLFIKHLQTHLPAHLPKASEK